MIRIGTGLLMLLLGLVCNTFGQKVYDPAANVFANDSERGFIHRLQNKLFSDEEFVLTEMTLSFDMLLFVPTTALVAPRQMVSELPKVVRLTHKYGSDNILISTDMFRWETQKEAWIPTMRSEFTFENGRKTSETQFALDENGQVIVPTQRTLLTYDDSFSSIEPVIEIEQLWDDEAWINNFKAEIKVINDQELEITEFSSPEGTWVSDYRDLAMEVDGNVVILSQFKSGDGQTWENDSRETFFGVDFDQLINAMQMDFADELLDDFISAFANFGSLLFPFDIQFEYWDGTSFQLEDRQVYERTLDPATQITTEELLTFQNYDNGEWIDDFRLRKTFDAGLVIELVQEDVSEDEGEYTTFLRQTFGYNSNNLLESIDGRVSIPGMETDRPVFYLSSTWEPLNTVPNEKESVPSAFRIDPAFPNPFNPSTTIPISLAESQQVSLSVFDATGRKVAEVFNGRLAAGTHQLRIDAGNWSSGIYFARFEVSGDVFTRQLTLLK